MTPRIPTTRPEAAAEPETPRRSRTTKAQARPGERPHAALEARLGYEFRKPAILTLALTHRSFEYEARGGAGNPDASEAEPGTDNEQLEFVGDAVLGLVVTEALFRQFPQCDEGELTRLRAALVSRASMAEFGLALRLGEHLRLGRGAASEGGRDKPGLLANAAEAVIAAVYLDAASDGDGLAAVRRLLAERLIEPHMAELEQAIAQGQNRGALRDYKTLLQERVQAEGAGKLRYIDTDATGPAHRRRFSVEAQLERDGEVRVLAAGEGGSKKEAQQRAAAVALQQWQTAAPASEVAP